MKYVIMISIFALLQSLNYAQENSNQTNNLISNTIKKLEKDILLYAEDIRRHESEINKCEKKITDSEKLIALSREKGNTKAEQVAKDALAQLTTAKEKNLLLLNREISKKKQVEKNILYLKNSLAANSAGLSLVNSVVLKYSGDVNIIKENKKQFRVNETDASLLESGDLISTSQNSKVELQFLEGRGNLVIGENSGLKFSETDSLDIIDFMKGKVKLGVQKLEEFEKEYKKFIKKHHKKFDIRTPSAVTSVRGTEFIIETSHESTYITVIEGSVEMKLLNDYKTILINAGERGMVNKEGILSDIIKIDLSELENWWDDWNN